MNEHKKMMTEEFTAFLNNGYNKKFVQDWLDLVRSEHISVNSTESKKYCEDKEALEILKFNAFFVPFNYLVRTYNFALGRVDSEKTLDEEVENFVEQIMSNDSETSLKDYNPFEMNDLHELAKNMDGDSLCQSVSNLFKNICQIHSGLFNNHPADTKTLRECNFVLDDFFTRFKG